MFVIREFYPGGFHSGGRHHLERRNRHDRYPQGDAQCLRRCYSDPAAGIGARTCAHADTPKFPRSEAAAAKQAIDPSGELPGMGHVLGKKFLLTHSPGIKEGQAALRIGSFNC